MEQEQCIKKRSVKEIACKEQCIEERDAKGIACKEQCIEEHGEKETACGKGCTGKSNMRVWIRADGNEQIASGHLMRTLSIAGELMRVGAVVTYLTADEESLAWLRRLNAEIPAHALGLPYGMPEMELSVLKALYDNTPEGERPDWILVDSYAVTASWLARIRTMGARIAFIDDERAFLSPADLIINYDPVTPEMEEFYRPVRGKCLLGPAYAPLRPQFADLCPKVRQEVRRILISTGGTDPFGMASCLKEIVTAFFEDEITQGRKGEMPELVFMAPGYARVEEPAGLMQECDLAVSAAGTTLYELCAAGVPTLTFAMADNQVIFADAMRAAGTVSYLGDIRNTKIVANMTDSVTKWMRERCNGAAGYDIRRHEADCMHSMTDGTGSRRIAEAMMRT